MRGAAARQLLLGVGLRLLELAQLVQQQRERVDRVEVLLVAPAQRRLAAGHQLAAERLGLLELAMLLQQGDDALEQLGGAARLVRA